MKLTVKLARKVRITIEALEPPLAFIQEVSPVARLRRDLILEDDNMELEGELLARFLYLVSF
jgi:hypothetical protein